MKIEMGESLFYSWLRHVKGCQIVQNNWKVSPQWELSNADELNVLMSSIDKHFKDKYGYSIFKGNNSLNQLLQQGECDVLGMKTGVNGFDSYAIDVAFHEAGLNYGDRNTTVMKVIEKCTRTAFCLYGYLNINNAEIVFASPKINRAIRTDLEPCIADLNDIFSQCGMSFAFCIIANEEFNNQVLQPILNASNGISDTSELFLRSYQLFKMFSNDNTNQGFSSTITREKTIQDTKVSDAFCELKVGQLAQRVLGKMLCDGCATSDELEEMQKFDYSKKHFDLQYPLLALRGTEFDSVRYYAKPIIIDNKAYYMCSQWFETSANNDRPFLLKWIALHSK